MRSAYVPEAKAISCLGCVLAPMFENHRSMLAAQAAMIPLTGKIALDRQLAEVGLQVIIDVQIEVSGYTGCADWRGRQSLHQSPDGL